MNKHIVTTYLSIWILFLLSATPLWAQGDYAGPVRYVKTDGAYANNGQSWATAKNNVQDAINDLYDYMQKNNQAEGRVYVAAGTYTPTESTESDKDGIAYTAFKIYEGITLYGGFSATAPEASPEDRAKINDEYGWKMTNETVLDGNHTTNVTENLTWNDSKQQFDTKYPGNSYHVVWFATKGFSGGRANALARPAGLDGFTIRGGYASNRTTGERLHNSFGAGAYMVQGSFLRNSIVTGNTSTRQGGGIYMDGGGEVDHCYIRYNQCLGVGIVEGFGGGIAVDGAGVVRHTVMAENVARIGGGLALLADETDAANRYAPTAAGNIVANNTTTTEAAGVYMRYGGVLNHMTIVNNRCNGRNIVYDGHRYGRSAGIYVDQYGQIFNSVCWGGKVEANSDIQYAAYTTASQTDVPSVHYSAFTQNDITDWSATTRKDVFTLSNDNRNTTLNGNYPEFRNPTTLTGVGIAADFTPLWQPYSSSSLKGAGVLLADYEYVVDKGGLLEQAKIESDIKGTTFAPKTTLGAYVPMSENIDPVELDGYTTLFVDPVRNRNQSLADPEVSVGSSWDNPLGSLNDALLYFKYYPANATKKGRILVKEGELTTTGNYITGRLRSSSFIMESNVEVYGGYPATLTGTNTTGRNPVEYPTHVTGNIAGDDYANNVHHLVRFQDVSNAVFDGFRLYYGNAYSENITAAGSKHGGGVIVYSQTGADMTGNALRNCIIANCTGLEGAAVYVTGLGTGGADDVVSLSMENCIIHNNEGKDPSAPSAICAKGSQTTITLNHCTIRGNVGFAACARDEATITLNNSVVHANAKVKVDNISTLTSTDVLTVYTESDRKINGSNNLVDNGISTPVDGTNNQAILTYASSSANYPSFVNPTRNVGVSEVVDNTVYGGYPNFMPENMSPLVNGASSTSASGTDITTSNTRNYGGLPDVGAVENTALPVYGTVYYVRKADGSDNDDGLSWANAFATVSKALEMAEASNGVCKQIWVAAGEYEPTSLITVNGQKSAYVMLEGVDVFGGFPQTGCPGMEERNPKQYISYLQVTGTKTEKDGSTINKRTSTSIGRVLVQAKDFTTETTWNGFAIRHGYLHACYRQNIEGNLNSIDKANVGLAGGAGVYLQANGILENCTIEDNLIYVYPGGANLSQSNSNAGGGYHQAGAGVYNSGGTIKNCVIRNNVLEHTLYSNGVVQSAWIYGAGLFMEDGNVFNTIITENECKINDNGLVGYHEVIVGAGAFLFKGNFYNNTIVSNQANTTNTVCNNVHISVPGLYVFDNITMYNCVVSENTSTGGTKGESKVGYPVASFSYSGGYNEAPSNIRAHYCVVNIGEADSKNLIKQNTANTNNIFSDPLLDISYLPQNSSPCINMGTEEIAGVTIPDVDAGYSERVQDCTIDIGAYEYNGAKNITPAIETTDGVTTAYYYITQNGRGTATAESPANAACREKLQKVLDAAGRYKYAYPGVRVVVKLAAMQSGTDRNVDYMPRRSAVTDGSADVENPRSFSIMVPRGVEVWGGYTDAYTSTTNHGFLETNRNVMTNRTTLNGLYQANGQDVNVYHVVTFTDLTFDADGKEIAGQTMTDKASAMGNYNKAVLDGLHITGGMANGVKAEDQRGGAAIVTDFAHVRNCIVRNNYAAEEGGALYLQPRSLVSGTLLEANSTGGAGGAIFVEEPTSAQKAADATGYARIYTSTIVKNSAGQGGGINFETNLRANSVVVWNNEANAQANVSGQLDPFSTVASTSQTVEDYPMSFSAVENLRVAGINNLSVGSDNGTGVHFNLDDGYYGLTLTSVLGRAGMRYQDYAALLTTNTTMLTTDFAGVDRVGHNNNYIDIGARAYKGQLQPTPSTSTLMKRLYVVAPELIVNLDAQNALVDNGAAIYKQQGSSFANPMSRLDDALEYIREARKNTSISGVADMQFEVFVSGGTFYPLRTIRGEYSYSRASTYLVPEGVSIVGGMDPDGLGSNTFYGQDDTQTTTTVAGTGMTVTIQGETTEAMREGRLHFDLNNNSIIEPWELEHQTILSGANVNSVNSENVYHVITAIAASDWVGQLPTGTAGNATGAEGSVSTTTGKRIVLDGLTVSDGEAYGYEQNLVGSKHTYYKGGAICVDGNWVTENGDDKFYYTNVSNPVGYRNIPLTVMNCQFSNNMGGMGGAIFSNGDLEIYGCSFAQNYSMGGTDVDEGGTTIASYTGNGGAVNASANLILVNSLFANNEARQGSATAEASGRGGAILAGHYSRLHVMNCNFVRNLAKDYPAIYNYVANRGWNGTESDDAVSQNNPHRVVNSIFWGNEVGAGGIHRSMYYGESGQEKEHLWFCAYGADCGLTPVYDEEGTTDYRIMPFNFATNRQAMYIPALFQKNGGKSEVTNNIILNSDNDALDGPNFINPSLTAGVDGYLASADWMLSRINNVVDNGWTFLNQQITTGDDGTYTCEFVQREGSAGSGIYLTVADDSKTRNNGLTTMPYGESEYMYYPQITNENTGEHLQMYRVSKDPNPTHQQTYIDMGVYEYQHVQLKPTTEDQIRDVLWVTETERQDTDGPADGSSWLRATSDLQRAIETLLSGRNGHDKEIRIIEGSYMPVYTIANNLGFKVSTAMADNTVLVDEADNGKAGYEYTANGMGVKSLTIKGGYSSESAGPYDYEKYPVTLVASERVGVSSEMLKHLFYIEDARQRTSQKSGDGFTNTATDNVIPITLHGLTFSNPNAEGTTGGAAICYADQMKEGSTSLNAPTDGKRLTLSNCTFLQNGKEGGTVPAVTIGQGGGDALIYNSLFHSNAGNPLEATDTKVVNCTFALNGGTVQLKNNGSELYNSILWKNNTNGETVATETSGLSTGVIYQHNAITGYTPTTGDTNEALSETNNDVFKGPNFVNPNDANVTARSFRISPSAILLSQGNEQLFAEKVGLTVTDDNYKAAVGATTDLAYFTRCFGSGLDLGAYECQEALNRVIYVDPNKVGTTGNGKSWESAYELNRLQNAIDAASVYMQTEVAEGTEKGFAYVFVKGKREGSTGEAITLREGVQIYGSIDPGYTDMAAIDDNTGDVATGDIETYEMKIRNERPGLAATSTYQTIVESVTATEGASYATRTMLDGFVVTSSNESETPVVNLEGNTEQGTLIMRNCIVAGNQVTGNGQPAVNVANGLLYNVLVQENTSGANAPVVKVGDHGHLVNCTVVAHETGKSTVTTTHARSVMNCVTFNVEDNTVGRTVDDNEYFYTCNTINASPFAPYLQLGTTAYHADKPAYLTNNHYLWYQLHEQAADLESAYEEVDASLPEKLKGFINFSTDRDALGNPRKLTSVVDRGCFETWNVKANAFVLSDTYIPEEGSVVYLQEGANLRLDANMTRTFRPTYLLLREGASLYGQGAKVEVGYVAIEKELLQGYALVALPYDYKLDNTVSATVNTDGILEETAVEDVSMHTYNGAERATYNYHYVTENSACWTPMEDVLSANKGVLFTAPATGTYRFTNYANAERTYLYTEGGAETYKEVELTQYNNTPADGASFTSHYNMGWNLAGMPYLVSGYKTWDEADGTYQMNIPHVFYTMDEKGKYTTAQSWDESSKLSVGNAFFTQTATLDAHEQLRFKLPVFPTANVDDTRALLNVTSEDGTDEVQLTPDYEAKEMTDYQLNYDGVKMMAMNKALTQIYALDAQGGRLSLVGSTPVEQEINLGLYTAKSDISCTFTLPNREAFADYGSVWLKDNSKGLVIDLMTENYTFTAKNAGTDEGRLTIQIGGEAPTVSFEGTDAKGNHVVDIRGGVLYIGRLTKGQTIQVYTTDGRMIHQAVASETSYSTAVAPGIYLVKIDNCRYKAL
ncbi:MAG: hypothetical protein IJZ45_05805 [Bacteroidaceae bacterium]|nr:hypothetical protein [Bacteroidaceae bacterium]